MSKTQVATTNSALLASADQLPEWLKKGDARGNEQVDSNDIMLPRIGIIQAISPQLKKNDPKYIAGAEQGRLYNTLTDELYGDEGILFVPVLFRKEWIAFKDREKGGGFKGAWPFSEEVRARTEIEAMEDGDDVELMESHSHIGFVVKPDGGLDQAIIACTKSAIKFSRKLNSLVTMSGVDRFAKAYTVSTVEASSAKGDYYTYDARPAGFVNQGTYKEAETLYEFLKDKAVTTNHEPDAEETGQKGQKYSAEEEKEF